MNRDADAVAFHAVLEQKFTVALCVMPPNGDVSEGNGHSVLRRRRRIAGGGDAQIGLHQPAHSLSHFPRHTSRNTIDRRRMLAIDPEARSSMWEDLERRRPTEIDYLQGAILALSAKTGMRMPLTGRIVELVKAAERARVGSPRLTPEQIGA